MDVRKKTIVVGACSYRTVKLRPNWLKVAFVAVVATMALDTKTLDNLN